MIPIRTGPSRCETGVHGKGGTGEVMGMDLTAWLEKQHIFSFYFRETGEGETIYIYETIQTRNSNMGNTIVRWPKK